MLENSFEIPKRDLSMTVLSNKPLSERCRHLVLDTGVADYPASAGQFVHVRIEDDFDPMFRRPFSIGNIRKEDGRTLLEILYIVVGRGTRRMTSLAPGNTIDVLGPLGIPFDVSNHKHQVLIGGGVGIPPLHYLLEQSLAGSERDVHLFVGGRSHEELYWLDRFEAFGVHVHPATDDGSHGYSGYVPAAFTEWIESSNADIADMQVYTCGPSPMLRAVQEACNSRDIACQISMEQQMGCALGVCWACIVAVNLPDGSVGHKRCCCEGPVFDSRELILTQSVH